MISSDMRIAHCTVLFWRLGRHFVYTPRLSTGHSCWIVFVLYPSTIRIVQVKITNSRRHDYLKAHQFQSAASASRHERWPTMTLKPSDPLFSPSASRNFTSFSLMGEWAKVGINPHFRCSILCSQAKHNPSSSDCLYVQKRALEMVESSRDPNMLTKIQELSRQVGIVFVFFLSYTRRVAFFLF